MRIPLDYPELPEAARARWPAWMGPVAMFASIGALTLISIPTLPLLVLLLEDGSIGALALLILLLVQDLTFVGGALLFANIRQTPRLWHFGLRATRLWPTVGWAVLGAGLLLGFEVGYIELIDSDDTNVEELAGEGLLAQFALCLGVIVVAPVTEEFFFRGFFYRALRSRFRVWSAALMNGVLFGALHFQGADSAAILPVIAVFGIGVCLVYELTQSLFAVIAIHAAFNTFAMLGAGGSEWVPLMIGLGVIAACVLVPRAIGPLPAPFPVPAR